MQTEKNQRGPIPSPTSGQPMNLEQMFGEAEETLRHSVATLNAWGEQARNILNNRPGVVLASISLAGFMTGLLMRQGKLNPRNLKGKSLTADPVILFATGAVAGFTVGPRVAQEIGNTSKTSGAPREGAQISPMRPNTDRSPSKSI